MKNVALPRLAIDIETVDAHVAEHCGIDVVDQVLSTIRKAISATAQRAK